MENKLVLSLFDYSGIMVKPWADAGFKCVCVDLKHEGQRREGNIIYYGADITNWLPPLAEYKIVFAFPPCTHVAVSGRAHFWRKGIGKLIEAFETFRSAVRICQWAKAPYMIENPVGTISTYYRKPDYYFDPYEYGGYCNPPVDMYTKKTCLWTGGRFIMPLPKPVDPIEGSKMRTILRTVEYDVATLRSMTPKGFAQAVFEANKEC